jgi:hypothetical protein
LSVAVAEIVTVFDTVPTGPAIDTSGGVVSGTGLLIVVMTGLDVRVLPEVSRATALRLTVPLWA